MNMNLKIAPRMAAVLLVSAVLAACTSAPNAPPADLLQRAESARTQGDYEALAAYYDKQAAAARGIATEHRKMARSFQGMVAGGRGAASMPAHCNAIADKNEGLAKDYDAMAAAFRQMAKQAQP
jgi:hypothetical protein